MFWLLVLACGGDAAPPTPAVNNGWADKRNSEPGEPAAPGASGAGEEAGEKKSEGVLGGLFGGEDCDDDSLASQPLKNACVTQTIECGQSIKGHTGGGSSIWNGDFYRSKFCAVANPGTYEGTERIYSLSAPAEVEVRVELVSDCGNLDLFMLSWPYPDECPTQAHSIGTCEADISSGGGRVMVQNIAKSYSYMIGVEASDAKGAPFELKVECVPLLKR